PSTVGVSQLSELLTVVVPFVVAQVDGFVHRREGPYGESHGYGVLEVLDFVLDLRLLVNGFELERCLLLRLQSDSSSVVVPFFVFLFVFVFVIVLLLLFVLETSPALHILPFPIHHILIIVKDMPHIVRHPGLALALILLNFLHLFPAVLSSSSTITLSLTGLSRHLDPRSSLRHSTVPSAVAWYRPIGRCVVGNRLGRISGGRR
ncbi:hypothetical protein DFP72DRAFT_944431, partial [Ephemerocybe angulata]